MAIKRNLGGHFLLQSNVVIPTDGFSPSGGICGLPASEEAFKLRYLVANPNFRCSPTAHLFSVAPHLEFVILSGASALAFSTRLLRRRTRSRTTCFLRARVWTTVR
jgi:hypothetical protein